MPDYLGILLLFCTLVILANGKSLVHQLTGEVALYSKYQPYVVAIKHNNDYTCSGTIISSTKILTTATCILALRGDVLVPGPKDWKNLTVYAGSASLSEGGHVHHIERIKVHDEYVVGKFAHDIAVLTLSTPIKYSDKEAPIRLPNSDIINNSFGVNGGWGMKSPESIDLDDNFQSFKKVIITADKCSVEFLKEEELQVDIDDFCGVSYSNNAGFYIGHSGSPMIQEGKVIGIVSWGLGGYTNNYFDVYTNVYKHLEFINKELQ